jgi:hypothetical protein
LVTAVEAAAQRPIADRCDLNFNGACSSTLTGITQAAGSSQLDALIYRIPDADLTVPYRFLARSWLVRP